MDNLKKRTWAEIDLASIEHNYSRMRARLPEGCRFMGVVKADSYGHGAIRTSSLLESLGCDYLAVASFDEAAELRCAGIGLPILIFSWTPAYLACDLAALGVTQAVADITVAREMSRLLSERGMKLKIHIKLETGMGRTGFSAKNEEDFKSLTELLSLPGLDVEGIFTHLAVSDEFGNPFTKKQFERFNRVIAALEKNSGHSFPIKHCANSGAMVNYSEMYMDMVRPGLALYGMYPGTDRGGLELRPAMELKTRIALIAEHEPGDTISYGRTFTVTANMRIAVLPIGYADGLHRVLSNKMEVLIHGRRARQVGRICMDMCMIDITDIPGCVPGDVVTIFGADGDAFLPVEEQAEKAGTISYEMVCAVSKRVPRVYKNSTPVT